jgi:hypothetical protein
MARGQHDNPNPYAGLSGGSGQQSVKQGQRGGRRPLDMASANLVHRTRNIGRFTLTAQPDDADTVTVTLGDGLVSIFEFDSGGGVAAGNIPVTIGGAFADTADNLQTALQSVATIDAAFTILRVTDAANEFVVLIGSGRNSVGASLAQVGINVFVDDLHGDVEHGSPVVVSQTRIPTGEELATGVMFFPLDFVSRGHLLSIRDPSNVLKAFDGSSSSDSNSQVIQVTNGAAAVPFFTGDTVSILAWGENVSWNDTVVLD